MMIIMIKKVFLQTVKNHIQNPVILGQKTISKKLQ